MFSRLCSSFRRMPESRTDEFLVRLVNLAVATSMSRNDDVLQRNPCPQSGLTLNAPVVWEERSVAASSPSASG